MVTLSQLLLPILLGGVAVFFASFLMRMVLPHHWSDFDKIPDEDAALEALRKAGVRGGMYNFPYAGSPQALKSPEWQEKWKAGPAGHLYVFPTGELNMGKSLIQSFLFNVVGSFFAAYLATMVLPVGADRYLVFRFISVVGFLVYGAALVWGPIWKATRWSVLGKELFDAFVYGMATGGVFAALWPAS